MKQAGGRSGSGGAPDKTPGKTQDGVDYEPRPGDAIVEPLLGALQQDPDECLEDDSPSPAPGCRRASWWERLLTRLRPRD